jgi:hypothetical protein
MVSGARRRPQVIIVKRQNIRPRYRERSGLLIELCGQRLVGGENDRGTGPPSSSAMVKVLPDTRRTRSTSRARAVADALENSFMRADRPRAQTH